MTDSFLAVDWGTTNRRVYRIEQGIVRSNVRDDRGIVAVPAGTFADEIALLRARHGDLPMLLAGMIGSNRGWHDAGYVSAPARLEDLAGGLKRIDARTAIVPGVSRIEGARGEVMRGEEVQLLGAAAAGLVPPDAQLCQPGTHCKWARLERGALTDFVTAMTGEMFALLKAHALIGQEMTGVVHAGHAFREGVGESRRNDLLASLFSVRPAALLNLRPCEEIASFVSGLLIGADCRAHAARGPVHLLADPALGALYSAALMELGSQAVMIDSHDAFVAGIVRIRELSR
ncbi:2-dehydro-3-deoxygalactonokinase [Novosphingobium sp. CF614]|uniref:2-dehydro-3-deoxygalactonokinase n=1 Tax=Novosphingobium sp. CF614 TaxID=1884364 RepID=UPI0008F0F31D|nr:2-dehydro-3-deoxygalactonokinase [Novosphingobium sp. CF614]SFF85433.1 2-dehydro-3-deoxygalactonokinase [Novosphingobium sp. CF614]